MDFHQLLLDIKDIGPSLASIVAIGVIVYMFVQLFRELLGMFKQHASALETINENMKGNTEVTKEVSHAVKEMTYSVRENTRATERIVDYMDKRKI